MKKVKIMLTAITVLAVVGGALAFKVKNDLVTFYTTNDPSNADATCPFPSALPATIKLDQPQVLGTFVQSAPCVLTRITTIEQ